MTTINRLGILGAVFASVVVLALVALVMTSNTPVHANSAPDLEVGTPSVDDANPYTGASFTLSATVTNAGDGASVETTLRYYRSTDATITTSDTELGTDAVGTLAAAGTSEQSIDLTAPSAAGTYYYGACVDSVTGESDTTDNCSASVTVTVKARPDLTVVQITHGMNLESPRVGGTFPMGTSVENAGSNTSGATTVRFYRSTDATITTSDTQVGTAEVTSLEAGERHPESWVTITAPSTEGTYYYGACVDTVTGESDTTNNCFWPSQEIPVPLPRPDLAVGSPSVDDASLDTGATFTLSAVVTNVGGWPTRSSTLRFYRSTDATITTSDAEVGTDEIESLFGDISSEESVSLTAPSTAGTYYYGACVDSVTGEPDTTNNCSSSVTVVVALSVSGITTTNFAENGTGNVATYAVTGAAHSHGYG